MMPEQKWTNNWARKYLLLELSQELYVRAKLTPVLGLAAVLILTIYFYQRQIHFPLLVWAGTFTVLQVCIYYLFFIKSQKPSAETYISWTWRFSCANWLAGLMWGFLPWVVFPTISASEQVALIMMMLAIASVPAPAFSRFLPLLIIFSTLLIFLVGFAFVAHHDEFDRHTALVIVVLITSLLYLLDQWGIAKELLKAVDDKRRLKTSGRTIKRLRHDRYHDSVTGLFNKVGLKTYLRSTGEEYSAFTVFALKVRDVDTLYSNHSKSSIDELIRDLAKRLDGCSFDQKTIAHLGLGEFLVLVPGTSSENMDALAHDFFSLFEDPFHSLPGPMTFSLAIGCALYPEHSTIKQGVIAYALTALKVAESQVGNQVQLYADEMAIEMNRRAFIRSQLTRAIQHEEFSLHIQPKLNLDKNSVDSAEVLVRWNSPTMGMVSPTEFIPVAESTSDIVPLGRWVLKEATRILRDASLPSKFSLAVNVSVKQLTDPQFVPHIQEIARQLDGTGRTLELEITESIMVTDEAMASKALTRVSELGIKLR